MIKPDLSRVRFVGLDKARLLRAVDRTRGVLGLRRALSLLGLSLSRFHAWARLGEGCQLDDQPSCPVEKPQRMTPAEVMTMHHLATGEQFRHVPTGRLALLAQRLAIVFASTSTWYRFVRERGWRRPTLRIHPHAPVEGVRAERPNELWHIDVTVLRIKDGPRVYLNAVIDNFSRRITRLAPHCNAVKIAGPRNPLVLGPIRRVLGEWRKWVHGASRPSKDGQPSLLEPMARVARTIKEHLRGILNYFRKRLTSGVIEGFNSYVQAARARARGYRNPETFKTMIYLIGGRLKFALPGLGQ